MLMFCSKCGAQIPEGSRFCPACGTAAENAATNAAVENSPAVQEEEVVFDVGPAVDGQAEATPVKKASRKKWLKPLLIATPILAVVVAVFLCWGPITEFYMNTFQNPEEELVQVEGENLKQLVGGVSQLYSSVANGGYSEQAPIGAEMDIDLTVDESLLSLAQAAGVDLSFLENVSIEGTAYQDGALSDVVLDLIVGDTTLVSIREIMDMENGKIYMGLPGLHDDYLVMDLFESLDGDADEFMEIYNGLLSGAYSFEDFGLPSAEKFEAILNKYLDLALGCIEDVHAKNEKVTAGGVTETLKRLELKIDAELVLKIAETVLNEMKNDEDILAICASMLEKFAPGENFDLADVIDEALASLPEADDEVFLILYDYLNDDGEVVGRRLVNGDGEEGLFYAYVEDGKDFAFTLSSMEEELLLVEGKTVDGKSSGTMKVIAEGTTVLTLNFSDFEIGEDRACGTISIPLPEEIMSELPMSGAQAEIVLTFDIAKGQGASFAISLEMAEKSWVSLVASYELLEEQKTVSVPSNATSITNEYGLMRWVSGLNTNELMRRAKACGLEDLLEQLMRNMY